MDFLPSVDGEWVELMGPAMMWKHLTHGEVHSIYMNKIIRIWKSMYMYVCIYVCMYICMYVCMYVWMYVSMFAICMYIYIHIYI
jgi:hypothetical protein